MLLQKAKPLHPKNNPTIANNINVTLRSRVEFVNFDFKMSGFGL